MGLADRPLLSILGASVFLIVNGSFLCSTTDLGVSDFEVSLSASAEDEFLSRDSLIRSRTSFLAEPDLLGWFLNRELTESTLETCLLTSTLASGSLCSLCSSNFVACSSFVFVSATFGGASSRIDSTAGCFWASIVLESCTVGLST